MNYILIDTAYIDGVAGTLRQHFAHVLDRQIPQADLAYWLDCLVLDAGLQPGENEVQVAFFHPKKSNHLSHFTPSKFKEELSQKAFRDNLGEFTMASYCVEDIVTPAQLMAHSLSASLSAKDTERIVLVGNTEAYAEELKAVCRDYADKTPEAERRPVFLASMNSLEGTGFTHLQVGLSLLQALGITADDLDRMQAK